MNDIPKEERDEIEHINDLLMGKTLNEKKYKVAARVKNLSDFANQKL